MITHDLGVVANIAQKIAVMYSGMIVGARKLRGYFLSSETSVHMGIDSFCAET